MKDLVPNKRNPRKIDDERLDMLKRSMEKFGDISGIVNNVRTNRLLGGHQRTKIIPKDAEIVIEKRYDPPTSVGTVAEGYVLYNGEKFKYREVDWDEDNEMAANIAANKQGGSWEDSILKDVLMDLDSKNYDFKLVGYTDIELENYLVPNNNFIEEINKGDENSAWVDMPEFKEGSNYIKLTYIFASEQSREDFILENNISVDMKRNDNNWICYK